MKITYTGRQAELTPVQLRKTQAKVAKVAKLLDGKGEREAHVILSSVRHLQKAEITVQFHDRQLVCVGSDSDPVAAIHQALDKLEKQAIKVRAKWRDTKRTPRKTTIEETVEAEPETVPPSPAYKVFKVNHHAKRKPITLDEAILEMENNRDYLVYRDADSDRICVLMRRRDGNFDLLES